MKKQQLQYPAFLENRGHDIKQDIEKYFVELIYNHLPVEPKMTDEEADEWMKNNVYNDSEAEKYLTPLFSFIESKIEQIKVLK
jgi:hypothetical protein